MPYSDPDHRREMKAAAARRRRAARRATVAEPPEPSVPPGSALHTLTGMESVILRGTMRSPAGVTLPVRLRFEFHVSGDAATMPLLDCALPPTLRPSVARVLRAVADNIAPVMRDVLLHPADVLPGRAYR